MSAPIGPGDWVQCISASHGAQRFITAGNVYCVDHFDHDILGACGACGSKGPGIQLVGIDLEWADGCFCHCMFQPLGGGQSKTIQTRIRPALKRALEPA